MAALEVVVGRQPIFDRARTVFGYELVFRTVGTSAETGAPGATGDQTTADFIFSSVSIGTERLVGDKTLFCNASPGVLTGAVPVLLPPERTVIEIAGSAVTQADVLAGCRRLHDQGFGLALDGVTLWSDHDYFKGLTSFVKVDIQSPHLPDLPALVKKSHRAGMRVIGENVDSIDEFEWCSGLGFDFLQGYLLARPSDVSGRALDPGRLGQLRLSMHLLDHECPIDEIEDIVRRDPAMTLQLLQLASIGAGNGMRRVLKSVREAIVLVGWRRLQSWVALLILGGKGQASEEAMTTALNRARMCEVLAPAVDPALSESAFMVGMVSGLGVLLDMPMEDILRDLPLDDGVRGAVLEAEGPLGSLVADVADFLVGQPQDAVRSGLDGAALSTAALEAMLWSVEVTTTYSRMG